LGFKFFETQLRFSVLVIQLSILQFILFFRGFLGLQTALDYLMGDNTRFCVIFQIIFQKNINLFFDFFIISLSPAFFGANYNHKYFLECILQT